MEGRKVVRVSFVEVYNLPLFEGYVVVDGRSLGDYEGGHITTAVHFGGGVCGDVLRDKEILFDILLKIAHQSPEFYSPIVIYGNEEASSLKRVEDFVTLFTNMRSYFTSHSGKPIHRDILTVSKKMANSDIWILEGGYESFQREFPILCGVDTDTTNALSLPCLIAPGLFLGSRSTNSLERRFNDQLSLDLHTLNLLGITHVLVHGGADLPIRDTDGIHLLIMDIPDTNDMNMAPYWENAIQLIEQVRLQPVLDSLPGDAPRLPGALPALPGGKPGKVLVQVHGRSRSAALMVAWCMKVLRKPFPAALEYVKSHCFYSLDASLMFLDQLQLFLSTTHFSLPQ
eukprot:TRINITY_DN16055_c0_g1_i1.p1 TRINITY_DN16055_c0_g1~~TRINITY_DN16055_c0_g1_i1.p1  ORF type:complete len:342 (-),score=65.86 TRINITY_DN16055_c0_g1_i1:193-1218(-)